MKSIRVWFEKDKECKFISHLDLNRVMLRSVQKSRIPVWHTEGFNPHPFITFALPLSLGFVGKRESMDFRLLDEEYPLEEIPAKLNACLPEGIRVYSAKEPVMKPVEIAFARFSIFMKSDVESTEKIYESVSKLLERDEIIVERKTKSGIKDINIKPAIVEYSIEKNSDGVKLIILLPAGSSENVNPSLLIKALKKYFDIKPYEEITRELLYNAKMQEFV